MVVLIDNYDSFTYNIVQYCGELGAMPKVIRNDELSVKEIAALNPKKLLLSPGPSSPNEAGITLEAIDFFKDKLPIFGICLGHQAIGQAFGATIVHAQKLMHGKIDTIHVIKDDSAIFHDIPSAFRATRYHSLAIAPKSVNDDIIITAETTDDREIMAIEIRNRPIYGVQFHPESVMSEYGRKILENFLLL
ncbi:MAG: aminodeoxychorismate/anthranilate synthase component II [Helicobacteraceae bacterium]|nr:aminodeoxychorismate/anthranilate synthase component II [Helicobacteraceae bacterium]